MQIRVPDPGDLADAASLARAIARLLRPGGLIVQDVQLSTLPFLPADRWWESIYVAATVRGLIRSTNGGSTWSLVSLPGSTADSIFERLEVCHAPSKPSVVYAAGVLEGEGLLWRRATAGGAFSSETPPPLKANSDIAQAW